MKIETVTETQDETPRADPFEGVLKDEQRGLYSMVDTIVKITRMDKERAAKMPFKMGPKMKRAIRMIKINGEGERTPCCDYDHMLILVNTCRTFAALGCKDECK
jgi:hypothetical protein